MTTTQEAKVDAWWFNSGDTLPHGDNRKIILGEVHSVQGEIKICENGLHWSRTPFQAVQYNNGPYLYKVRAWGDSIEGQNKGVSRYREYIAVRNIAKTLHCFLAQQALLVSQLWGWDMPDKVRQYLETGNSRLKKAAKSAAWNALRQYQDRFSGELIKSAIWSSIYAIDLRVSLIVNEASFINTEIEKLNTLIFNLFGENS